MKFANNCFYLMFTQQRNLFRIGVLFVKAKTPPCFSFVLLPHLPKHLAQCMVKCIYSQILSATVSHSFPFPREWSLSFYTFQYADAKLSSTERSETEQFCLDFWMFSLCNSIKWIIWHWTSALNNFHCISVCCFFSNPIQPRYSLCTFLCGLLQTVSYKTYF